MNHAWYALHVRARFEKIVERKLQEKGFEAFLPTYLLHRHGSDRVKSLSLPLFPGYMFCRFDLQARLPILVTPGVQYIVGAGKAPIAVDESEIAAIHHVLKSGVAARPWPYVGEGEKVRVVAGPLEGLTGLVVREKGCDRLVVSVTLLMRSVAAEIDRRCIRPLEWLSRTTPAEILRRGRAAS